MFGLDLTAVLLVLAALVGVFFALDFLFAGGGMTSTIIGGAMQCGAAMMSGPYGWALIVVIILVTLGMFGLVFGYR